MHDIGNRRRQRGRWSVRSYVQGGRSVAWNGRSTNGSIRVIGNENRASRTTPTTSRIRAGLSAPRRPRPGVTSGSRAGRGGLAVAAAVSSVMTSLLYGVEPTDPLTIVAACFALLAVALVAGLVPVRRALRVDPVTALRHE